MRVRIDNLLVPERTIGDDTMLGRILDMNNTDAFVSFDDGTTADIGLSHLPKDSKIGDKIDIERTPLKITNDKLVDFF